MDIPYLCATNLSPREAELIRIRIPDTYFNMFALTLIYSKCSWKREERKREDKGGGKETAKFRVNERKKEAVANDRKR